jgi:7-keto-8-aminopelargonate synthetase-like enzyme
VAIRPPTVPDGSSRLRFAHLDDAAMDRLLAAVGEL